MNKEDQIKITKELKEVSGIGLVQAKRVLNRCNWNINKSIKYIKDYPWIVPMDYWVNRKYCFCPKCDRFYVVDRNCNECKCGNKFM